MRMKKALVTGCCGFIGSHVTKELVEQGWYVEGVDDLSNGLGPENYRFCLGYTGWDKNQLDKEIENGDWLLMPSSSKLIFNTPDEKKWSKASSKLGVDIMNIGGNAGFA